MKLLTKYKFILLWFALSSGLGGYYYYLFYVSPDKTALLPGVTTDAHHQIEMQCSACHTNEKQKNIFTSSGVPNSACTHCHGADLEKFSDSHPVRKFKNPNNAVFAQHIDALNCITCHSEHNQKITGAMAVSLPDDYCAHCHESTLKHIESHRDLSFKSCATAGCHNYHDNTALAPSYLLKHFGEKDILDKPLVPLPTATDKCPTLQSLSPGDPFPASESCAKCHDGHDQDFENGKHGMRLAFDNLGPMTPSLARIPMKAGAAHATMNCATCHEGQRDNRNFASQAACLQCHDDEHSRNHESSTHHTLWLAEVASGQRLGTGVSCATCHMPTIKKDGDSIVSHDQSANLRPNEKMIKSVCTNCHGLQFTMDALSDPALILANFNKPPGHHHPGIDWTVESAVQRGDKKTLEMIEYLKTLKQPHIKK